MAETAKLQKRKRWFLLVFSILMIATAGTAFVFKLIDFFVTATHGGPDALGSFLIPVLNYLLVAAGFVCLLIWAVVNGMFRDVEGPKYTMLEHEQELDRLESNGGSASP